jgi:DNA-directed RNA polymerase beta' subunit
MNTYSKLLKKENILIKKNKLIKSSSQYRFVFFKKEKYGFFFIKKNLNNQISYKRLNKYSIICSATKEQQNYFNENSKLNNSFTLQRNKVDYRFQIYNSTKSSILNNESKMQKETKNYNLNFLKKLNNFHFLFQKNATNKWVNWVNDVNIESFTSELQVQKSKFAFASSRFFFDNRRFPSAPSPSPEATVKKRSEGFAPRAEAQKGGDEAEQEKVSQSESKQKEENPLNKNLYKSGYSKIHELKLVSVEIASPEKIKEWAEKVLPNGKVFGEVTNANTLHYKTFKPHKGGLFCERIFGPLKDFECACGVRSKPMEFESFLSASPTENQQKKRFFCMNCDVEYTWSVIRRYQLGYIQFISPVSHIWFLKANPSYLSLLLDFRRSHLESIIYCTEAITLENLWKSSQTLGLDTSPSTLYSIWQKLLEEEKLIKRKHKEIKKIESLFHYKNKNETKETSKESLPSSHLQSRSERSETSASSSPSLPAKAMEPTRLSFADAKKKRAKGAKNINFLIHSQLKQNKKHLNLMDLYLNNKDLFYKTKNIMYDYIQNSFYKNKILSNNKFYNYEKSYKKSLKLLYKKTFFQVLAFANNTLLISHLKKQMISYNNELINFSQSEKQDKVYKQNKEIMQFKDNFLRLAESFFQIYFIKLYLKETNLIIQIPNSILQVFCEFFLFYCIQIKKDFYIKKNPLNNLPKILSFHKETYLTSSAPSNKNNQIFYLKKIKQGNNKILKVSSKIKKGIRSTTGLYYYTGICILKKQIKLNSFFQKNKKILTFASTREGKQNLQVIKNDNSNETTYKMNFNQTNNLFENVKVSLKSIKSFNTSSSISISKSFIQNIESKKQTNLLQNLIREIYYKNDILSEQKNRKNLSDILYLLYKFYKKNILSYKKIPEIEYKFAQLLLLRLRRPATSTIDERSESAKPKKAPPSAVASAREAQLISKRDKVSQSESKQKKEKKSSMLSNIYSLNTFLNLFYIKTHKYKFSEIVNLNKIINSLCIISNNKKYKLTKKYNIKKNKNLKIQSENLINLTKNCSNLNLNKTNTLNQRKKLLFLQKQKSLNLRNPQFFSSIYSYNKTNNIYDSQFSESYNKKQKERQYKDDFRHIIYEEQSPLQKKMLKNDLYTISYSHLWPLNADWKSFFYYNSAPKDFEDTYIYYSYRKRNFYNKSNKFSTKLDSLSEIEDLSFTRLLLRRLGSITGGEEAERSRPATSTIDKEAELVQQKTKETYSLLHQQNAESLESQIVFASATSPPAKKRNPFRFFAGGDVADAYNKNDLQLPKKELRFAKETRVTKTTEFLSKMNTPLAGAAIVKKLLSEYTPSELKKMVKQHQVLLPKLNQNIRQLKEKAIKKLDFVKIQKLLNKRDHIIRRLKLIRKFSRKNVDPTSMILSVLPVLPPDLRPILKLQNQIAASDLNRLYQRIIYRNERLKKFLKDPSTSQSFEMKYAQRLLQEAVDNLIQNGKGNVKPETNSRGQALKSLSEILKGKQGRFRQYLLGKRVDYSGRSVIVVGPKLKLYECGLPKEMAIELFLPFLIKRILHYKIARTVIGAKNFLYSNKTYCINLLNEIMRNHPVLLNRAPTLHRLGIQAFQPKLVEGRAILLHPLVCPAFNADFDGDQMAVHLPITVEARAEAWTLIFSRNHLISPATGDPIVLPSQDMVLGCYYLTSEKKNIKRSFFAVFDNRRLSKGGEGEEVSFKDNTNQENITNGNLNINDKKYKNFFCISNLFHLEKVLNAYQLGKISVQSIVWIKWKGKTQFANEPLSMIEIRLNRYGIRDQIHSKSYTRIDKEGNLLNQYIRTTPGRILINNIAQKCMLL